MTSIVEQLHSNGFAVVEEQSLQAAENLVQLLGQEILRTNVKIEAAARAMVVSDESIEWHQDSPGARWIAWYCINPGSRLSEPTEILDTQPILQQLTEGQRQSLSNVQVVDRTSEGNEFNRSLYSRDKLYYCPWLIQNLLPQQSEINDAYVSLKSKIDSQNESIYAHKWMAGQILIIDNHRFLHRRHQLAVDSPRHLIRFWIAENGLNNE